VSDTHAPVWRESAFFLRGGEFPVTAAVAHCELRRMLLPFVSVVDPSDPGAVRWGREWPGLAMCEGPVAERQGSRAEGEV